MKVDRVIAAVLIALLLGAPMAPGRGTAAEPVPGAGSSTSEPAPAAPSTSPASTTPAAAAPSSTPLIDGRGVVTGRAYQERARPTSADLPMAGVEVMVVPRSEEFLERLEAIKAHARDSLDTYQAAPTEIQFARDAYERELRASGKAEAVFKTAAKPDGTFSVANVPPGTWTVIGVKSTLLRQDRTFDRKLDRDGTTFIPVPRLKSIKDLTVWLQDVTVASGEPATVEFTDRNLWFSGALEERKILRPAPPKSGQQKR